MLENFEKSPAFQLLEGDSVELTEDFKYFSKGTRGYIDFIQAPPVKRN